MYYRILKKDYKKVFVSVIGLDWNELASIP